MDLCKFHYTYYDEIVTKDILPSKLVNKVLQNIGSRLKNIFFIFLINELLIRYENNWDYSRVKQALDFYIKEKIDNSV